MNYIISQETGDAILSYLGTRPFIEVEGLINALRNLQQFEEDPIEDLPVEDTNEEVKTETPQEGETTQEEPEVAQVEPTLEG